MKIAIVTAASLDHVDLALDLVRSVSAHAPFEHRLFCMDVGLDDEARASLNRDGAEIVQVGWDYPGDFPGPWFRALSARPHIPRYIPNFDVYVWLDADCWVQDGFALQEIVEATAEYPVAAVSYIHPGYRQLLSTAPNTPGIPYHSFFSYLFSQLLEKAAASPLLECSFLTGCTFAARSQSPLWSSWGELLAVLYPRARRAKSPPWRPSISQKSKTIWKGAVTNTALFHADEVALNAVSYLRLGNPAILSARCCWGCSQAIPMLDERGFFVDTIWPHERIGIIHMSAKTKEGVWRARTSDGGYVIAGSDNGYYNGDVWVIKFAAEPVAPNLSFTVTGGLGIHVKITNNGTMNATNVPWQIHVEGGIFHLISHNVNGTVNVAVGETKTVGISMFFGLGSIQVTIMVGDATKVVVGTQVLIFSILKR